ncbi:J517_1871 family lipoprotein [Marinobacter sp. Hex_13]|uniref:J517_1871 family lipoprotein n=1 Tax=Marinobacter sp. Hex_13 TaxID=1795866 RepID=UPI0007918535|nr:J517_1871 family lipoprotein [Marinobacter sp. Hex_13]KXJ45896.1 MAG: hypothetical protein AXW11_12465 [Marinobacter sp. Hex_13]
MIRFTNSVPLGMLVFLIAPALTACKLSWEMPDASKYIHAQAKQVPAYAVGTWTGGMGPFVMTMQVDAGGTAVICHSSGHKEATGKAKHKDGVFYFSDGGYAELRQGASGEPELVLSGDDNLLSQLREDSSLTLATPYCAKFFTELDAQ